MNLETLTVRIAADNSELVRATRAATSDVERFAQRTEGISGRLSAALAGAFSFAAITAGLGRAFQAADAADRSFRQMAGTAAISGLNLNQLAAAAQRIHDTMGVSTVAANGLSTEVAKLASKAGEMDHLSEGMQRFLALGGARGLGAAETLDAVRQAVLGIDEGTDKLFGKNPSVLYREYADSIHTTVGRLTDAQKAQAIWTAGLRDGGRAAQLYADYLQSPQGQLDQLKSKTEDSFATLGRSLEVVRTAAIPTLASLAEGFSRFVGGIQLMGAQLPVFAAQARVAMAKMRDESRGALGNLGAGAAFGANIIGAGPLMRFVPRPEGDSVAMLQAELERTRAAYEAEAARIVNGVQGIMAGLFNPPGTTGGGATGGGRLGSAITALSDLTGKFRDEIKEAFDEWKRLEAAVGGRALLPNLSAPGEVRVPGIFRPGGGTADISFGHAAEGVQANAARASESLEDVAGSLQDLSVSVGSLSPRLRNAITGIASFTQGITSLQTAKGFFGQFTAAAGILGGAVGALQGITSLLNGAGREISRNIDALARLRFQASGFDPGAESSLQKALNAVLALQQQNFLQRINDLSQTLSAAGLDQQQFEGILQALNLATRDEQGRITLGTRSIDEFVQALRDAIAGTKRLGDETARAAGLINLTSGYRLAGAVYQIQDPRPWTPPTTGPAAPPVGSATSPTAITFTGPVYMDARTKSIPQLVEEIGRHLIQQSRSGGNLDWKYALGVT